MLLSHIMTSFHNYPRRWVIQHDRDIDLYSFAFLSGAGHFEPNVLYIGNVSDLPKTVPAVSLTFVCIKDEVLPSPYLSPGIHSLNLITLDPAVSLMELLKILTELFGNAAKVSSGRSHLIDTLHSNQGLAAIVDKAYQILDNPIIVVDNSYKILAMYQDVQDLDGREDLEEQRTLGYMLQSNIDKMQKARLYERTREQGYPFYNREQDAKHGWITALIYIHGIEVGQIGVMDSRHAFREVDFELIDFLCKVISLELQKSDFYRTDQGLMHSYFLSDLLENQIHDTLAINQRMQNLGWHLAANLYVMVVGDSAQNFFNGKAQLITTQLQNLLPESRWVIYQGDIVFLVSSREAGSFPWSKKLSSYLEINRLTAAVSNCFGQLQLIRKYYLQAKKAELFGRKFHQKKSLYLYSDYMFYHMGELILATNPLSDFYHPAIPLICAYDKAHHTKFLETLKLYLTYIDKPGQVAEELFVHKNTVFYRIAKLKEQFGLNLDDGEERFLIQLTIKLMELEDKL